MGLKSVLIGRRSILISRNNQDTGVYALIDEDSCTSGIFSETPEKPWFSLFTLLAVSHVNSEKTRYFFKDGVYRLYTLKIEMCKSLVEDGEPVPLKNLPLYIHWPQKSKLFDEYLQGTNND